MKKVLLAIAAVLLLFLLGVGVTFATIFGGNQKVTKQALGPHSLQVVDGYVTTFVLDGGEGQLALVDCGNDPTGAALLEALREAHHSAANVKAIFLTHGHPDHTGACHLFSGAQVYAFEADVKLAAGEARAKGPLPSKMSMPAEKRVKVTQTLTDGQTVNVGALAVRAFALPGHTGGSAAYLAEGVLYLGDSASGRDDGKSIKSAPWLFSDDSPQNVAELGKLSARLKAEHAAVTTLAFGHSGPLQGAEIVDALDLTRR